VVVSTPSAYSTLIKEGDIVIIHHNVLEAFLILEVKEKTVDLSL
jgi:hypothetical protein